MNLSSEGIPAAASTALFPWLTSVSKAVCQAEFSSSAELEARTKGPQKSVFTKMTFALKKALDRETASERSA